MLIKKSTKEMAASLYVQPYHCRNTILVFMFSFVTRFTPLSKGFFRSFISCNNSVILLY